ncbi:MAG: hypothetical protein ACI9Y8_001869 [Candidatus Omnitrophota bacterium]|jgi:hypothetical protein
MIAIKQVASLRENRSDLALGLRLLLHCYALIAMTVAGQL